MTERKLIKRQKENNDGRVICLCGCHTLIEPEIGKTYYVYDDGKVRKSREYKVTITGKVHSTKLCKNLRKEWEKNVIDCYWLYLAKEHDIFYGEVETEYNGEKNKHIEYFCMTQQNTWFSFASNNQYSDLIGGELDITGELHNMLE